MARYGWRRYWKRYYRRRYNSYNKTRTTRNFKASASNMTQGGTFNISVRKDTYIPVTASAKYGFDTLDVAGEIKGSPMHQALSNVFDQYRVEKVTIRIRPVGDSSGNIINPSILFSAVDRSGFAANAPITTLRTYGSYKETQITGAKDVSPVHTIYIGQTNLVEFSSYSDSKNAVSFPAVGWGCIFAALAANTDVYFSIEFDCQIRYRGVRYDNSNVH